MSNTAIKSAYIKDVNTGGCIPLIIGSSSSGGSDPTTESGLYLWETETIPDTTEYILSDGNVFPSPNKKYYQLMIGAIEMAFDDFEIDNTTNKLTLLVPPKNVYPVKLRFWSTKNAPTTSAVIKHVFTTVIGTTIYSLTSETFPSIKSSDYLVTLDRKELNEDEFIITENSIELLVPVTTVTTLVARYFQTQTQYLHSGIPEAPEDTNTYLRSNGMWVRQNPGNALPGELKTFISANNADILAIEQRYDILHADGREISRAEHANLFSVIGTKYGAGDGATTFNLPKVMDKIDMVLYSSLSKNIITDAAAPSTGGGLSLVYLSDEDNLFATNLEASSQCYKFGYDYDEVSVIPINSLGVVKSPMVTHGRRNFYNPVEKAIYSCGYSSNTMTRFNLATLTYENAGFGDLFSSYSYSQTCDTDGNFYIPADGVGIYKVPPSKDSKTLVVEYATNGSDSNGYHFAMAKFPKSNRLFASVGIGTAGGPQGYYIFDLDNNSYKRLDILLPHGSSNSNNVRAVPFVSIDSVLVVYSNGDINLVTGDGIVSPLNIPGLKSALTSFGVGVATVTKDDIIQYLVNSASKSINISRYAYSNISTFIVV